MNHEATLIATVAAGLGLATLFGLLAAKLRMPPIAGYLLAGIAIGPHTRGFVGNVALAGELAEIGVILLMFGVGLRFSLHDLVSVRRLAIGGAVIQVFLTALLGACAGFVWQWSVASSVVFGLCLSVASTVALLRTLESRSLLTSFEGRVLTGWLVVQDLLTVLVLVLMPPIAGILRGATAGQSLLVILGITVAKIAAFSILILVAGRKLLPRVLWVVAKNGSRELFTLSVVAIAVGVAFASSQLFGLSFALGAFFAGVMLRESELSHRAAEASLPLQDACAALFFVSAGMLVDPAIFAAKPAAALATLLIVMAGTPLIAAALVKSFRYPLTTAITVGAGLGQIGEFSFILASTGVSLGLLSSPGRDLVLAAAITSLALNPILVAAAGWLTRRLHSDSHRDTDPLSALPADVDSSLLTGHVVLIGYGRVGRRISDALVARAVPHVVIERSRELVEELRRRRIPAVAGDASETGVLIQGHVARGRMLVIAMPDTRYVRRIAEVARLLNPRIGIVVRTHSDEEAELFRGDAIGEVFMGEHELALGMTRHVLERMAA